MAWSDGLEPLQMPSRAVSPIDEQAEDDLHEQVVQTRCRQICTPNMTTETFLHRLREFRQWGEVRGLTGHNDYGDGGGFLLSCVADYWPWTDYPANADAFLRGIVKIYSEEGAVGEAFWEYLQESVWPLELNEWRGPNPPPLALEDKLRRSVAVGLIIGRAQVHRIPVPNGANVMHMSNLFEVIWPALFEGTLSVEEKQLVLPALCAWLLAGASEIRSRFIDHRESYIEFGWPGLTWDMFIQKLNQLLETLEMDEQTRSLLRHAIGHVQDSSKPDLTSEETWQAVTANAWWAERLRAKGTLDCTR